VRALLAAAAILAGPVATVPAGLAGYVVGCSHVTAAGCRGFWWYAAGGPTVYSVRTRQPIPGYAYVDDTTPCGPGEPYPMDTLNAPDGSPDCEQAWVWNDRARDRTIYAAAAGSSTFNAATTLREWYARRSVPCGAGGYILRRYYTPGAGIGPQAPNFARQWRSAQRCRPRVLAWY